jgi:hypothetical protein
VTVNPPRILDASALVRLFDGHPQLLRMLDDAEAGRVFLLLPTAAIAQAQRALRAESRLWDPFLLFAGVRALELTEHTAIEAGLLEGPIAVTQGVYEARMMNAAVVTAMPQAYTGHPVALAVVEP